MSKLLKKFFVSFLIAVFLLLSVRAPYVKAQQTLQPWYNQDFGQWSAKVFDSKNANEIFGERYTFAQVTWIVHSLTAILLGGGISGCITATNTGSAEDIGDCISKLPGIKPPPSPSPASPPASPSPGGMVPTQSPAGQAFPGAIIGLANLSNNILVTRPASGIQYLSSTASRLHIIPEAYAQGAGYKTLQPLQVIWQATRNMSYFLLILAFIVMAFMIMFRVKISPQVAITVQSALPKLVTTLILITFSYAIAGLLVDLSYLSVGVLALAIKTAGSSISNLDVIPLFTQLSQGNGLASALIGIGIFALLLAIVGFVGTVGAVIVTGGTAGAGLPLVVGGVLLLIFAIFLLLIIVRILWLILRTLANTVLLILGAPLMILLGVFPNAGGFGGWIKSMAANLAVYPTIIILTFLSHYFFWGWFAGGFIGRVLDRLANFLNTFQINTEVLSPTLIVLPGAPNILGNIGVGTNIIGFALAFILLFLIPKAADIIQSLIAGKPFAFGTALGEALTPFTVPTRYVTGAAGKVAQEPVGKYIVGRVSSIFSRSQGGTKPGEAETRAGPPPET